MIFSTLFITLFAAVAVNGFPTGAPTSVCDTMAPGHGHIPQASPFPYDTIIEKSTLNGGESTNFTIKAGTGDSFKGFFIQARIGDEPIGTFTVDGGVGHLLDCGNGEKNAVTHSSPDKKTEVTVVWTAPADFKGIVTFYTTIVKVFNTYWVKHPSSPVQVV